MPVRTKDGQELKVVVVMPAYNAAKTLKQTYDDIPPAVVDQIILVDDVSQDATVEIARDLGIDVVVHLQNRGYGGNQKTCYIEALRKGADIVVMLHPDYQYDSTLVPQMIAPIVAGEADLVLGSRMLGGGALQGGMPIWKFIANKFLTGVENLVFHQHLSEYHTGFRAYNRKLLETLPFLLNKDSFVFDTEVLAEAIYRGMVIAEIPVPTRYFKEASSVNFKRSVIYGLETLGVTTSYMFNKWGLARAPKFRKTLSEVVSRHYREEIFRRPSATEAK